MAHLPIRLTQIYFSKQLQTNVLWVCLMNHIKENRITVFCTGNCNFCQNNLENTISIFIKGPFSLGVVSKRHFIINVSKRFMDEF